VIHIPFEIFSLCLISLGLSLLLILWYYYDWKQIGILKKEKVEKAFYCIKCKQLYSIKQDIEISDCPKCGYENGRLQF